MRRNVLWYALLLVLGFLAAAGAGLAYFVLDELSGGAISGLVGERWLTLVAALLPLPFVYLAGRKAASSTPRLGPIPVLAIWVAVLAGVALTVSPDRRLDALVGFTTFGLLIPNDSGLTIPKPGFVTAYTFCLLASYAWHSRKQGRGAERVAADPSDT